MSIRERTEKKIQKQNYFIIIVHEQCEQVGRFLKVVWTTLVTKIDKIFSDTLGHFEKLHFLRRTAGDTFGQLFEKISQLFTPTSGHIVHESKKGEYPDVKIYTELQSHNSEKTGL